MKKNKIIRILATIGCLALATGTGLATTKASAASVTLGGVDVSSFSMEYGASVRFKSDDPTYKNGIRFAATLSDDAYTALEGLSVDVNYGMLIVPADIAKTNPLTVENIFGNDASYCLEDPKQGDETEGCTCSKQHIASVEYAVLADEDATDGVKNLRGSLVDIRDSNLTREFIGLGYIEYNGTYVLAANAKDKNGEGEADVKNNTRSMTYVAQLAIDDDKDDANNTLYNTYVGKLSNYRFAYTVNHYLPDDAGEYGAPVSEKLYAPLSSEVAPIHILEGDYENKDNYSAYRLYEISDDLTTKVYANGKTVIDAYYTPMDTTFHNTVANNAGWYFMGANTNTDEKTKLEGATTAWHDTLELGGETKTGVVQINTTAADAYTAGKFNLAIKRTEALEAMNNDWAYIKLHAYIVADSSLTTLNMYSFNKQVTTAKVGEWTDIIVPLAKLNQAGTYVFGTSFAAPTDKETFYEYSYFDGKYMWDGSVGNFLCTNSVKTGIGLTTTDITYYIDEISWGIDTKAPEITVTGLGNEMYEGTFTEPTVTVTDDMALQSLLDTTVEKKLYQVVDGVRSEVTLTDGSATLTKGSYVYVVTADDRIYTDVVGNVATKEIPFEVVEKQDIVVTFGEADTGCVQKDANQTYTGEPTSTYLNATDLANEGLTGEVEGGAIKFEATAATGTSYGAWVKFVLEEDILNQIDDATAITIKMAVKISDVPSWAGGESFLGEVVLLDGATGGSTSTKIVGFDRDTWVDVTLTKDELAASIKSYFDGTQDMFWLNSDSMNAGATITYYINSITFDVTP